MAVNIKKTWVDGYFASGIMTLIQQCKETRRFRLVLVTYDFSIGEKVELIGYDYFCGTVEQIDQFLSDHDRDMLKIMDKLRIKNHDHN